MESDPPPMLAIAKQQVDQLDYDFSCHSLPIAEALQKALLKVLFQASYSEVDTSQQILSGFGVFYLSACMHSKCYVRVVVSPITQLNHHEQRTLPTHLAYGAANSLW